MILTPFTAISNELFFFSYGLEIQVKSHKNSLMTTYLFIEIWMAIVNVYVCSLTNGTVFLRLQQFVLHGLNKKKKKKINCFYTWLITSCKNHHYACIGEPCPHRLQHVAFVIVSRKHEIIRRKEEKNDQTFFFWRYGVFSFLSRFGCFFFFVVVSIVFYTMSVIKKTETHPTRKLSLFSQVFFPLISLTPF